MLATWAAPALAIEGRIPIFQATTITQPGHYDVTNDIQVTGGDAIVIDADGVTLDLNGRSVSSSSSTGTIIRILAARRNISIRGGRLSGGAYGVYYLSTTALTRVSIEDVEVLNVATDGIHLEGVERADISDCILHASGHFGIYVRGVFTNHFTGRIIDNTIDNAGYGGIYVADGDALEIRGNIVTDSDLSGACCGVGIGISGTGGRSGGHRVDSNTIQGGGPNTNGLLIDGSIVLGDNSLIINNVITGNGAAGIVLDASGNRVVGNVVGANGSHGIRVAYRRNLIDGNQVEGNSGNGLFFLSGAPSTGHVYRNNMLRGNTLGGVSDTGGTATDGGGNAL